MHSANSRQYVLLVVNIKRVAMYLNSSRERILKYILLVVGCISVSVSLYMAHGIYFSNWSTAFSQRTFKLYHFVLLIGYLFLTFFTGLNKSFFRRKIFGETVVLLLFWFHQLLDSKRLILAYFVAFFIPLETLFRLGIKFVLLRVYYNSKFSSKLFVVCDQSNCLSVVESLRSNLDWSRRICGLCVVDYEKNYDLKLSDIFNGKITAPLNYVKKDDLQTFLTSNNVDELFVYTDYAHTDEQLKRVISDSEKMGIRVNVRINLDLFDFLPKSYTKIDRIGKYYCVSISRNFVSYRSRVMKGLLDYLGGFVGFLIFCVAFIILGPVIKLDSKGPIIFSQNRVGRNGRIFKCYKFRSMRPDAENLKKDLMTKNEMNGLMFKMDNDPRVTRIGKFLRKTSLDELPQFINVLKGDMSLVGTRPPTVDEYEKYQPEHKARVSMMPGLTGLWQVSGRSDIKDFNEVVKLDMQYIDNSSFWLDVKIILMTVKVVLFGKGAK